MAKLTVPYLIVLKPGPRGGPARYYWQPAQALRAQGWRTQRVPDQWASFATDPDALEAAALAKARALNSELAAWRTGVAPSGEANHRAPPKSSEGLAAAITLYKASRFYTRLRASTRRVYDQNLVLLETWARGAGDPPVRAFTPRDVDKLYMSLQPKTPTRANHVITMLRVLLDFCRREGLVRDNAAAHPRLIGRPPSGRIWPRQAVALFVQEADRLGYTAIGTAVLVNEWLGQREGDVLRMRPPALAGGDIVLRQSKTLTGVRLPISAVPALAERLAAELARRQAVLDRRTVVPLDLGALPLILDEDSGRAYSPDTFRHRFAAIRRAVAAKRIEATGVASFPVDYIVAGAADEDQAGLKVEDLLFRHLRHTAVVRLAEAEVDNKLISAITGHRLGSINSILERYLVRTGDMARTAFAKRLAKEQADG